MVVAVAHDDLFGIAVHAAHIYDVPAVVKDHHNPLFAGLQADTFRVVLLYRFDIEPGFGPGRQGGQDYEVLVIPRKQRLCIAARIPVGIR